MALPAPDRASLGLARGNPLGTKHLGLGSKELRLSPGDRARRAHLRGYGQAVPEFPHARDVCLDRGHLPRPRASSVLACPPARKPAAAPLPDRLSNHKPMTLLLDNACFMMQG